MKFLLLLIAVLVVVWLLRGARRRVDPPAGPPSPAAAAQREAIVGCTHCGLMLPVGETLPGRGGVFCCEAHRAAHEQSPQP